MKTIKTLKITKNDDNDRGLWADWEKQTFNKGLYYINESGIVCSLPDNPEDRVGIRKDFVDSFK